MRCCIAAVSLAEPTDPCQLRAASEHRQRCLVQLSSCSPPPPQRYCEHQVVHSLACEHRWASVDVRVILEREDIQEQHHASLSQLYAELLHSKSDAFHGCCCCEHLLKSDRQLMFKPNNLCLVTCPTCDCLQPYTEVNTAILQLVP